MGRFIAGDERASDEGGLLRGVDAGDVGFDGEMAKVEPVGLGIGESGVNLGQIGDEAGGAGTLV